jgi:catechol 2,3-dioxygenase-like lactoylglutathione lyase family enzyme
MAIDHLSFGTTDMAATRAFWEGALGFPVVIHERMLVQEGGTVEHVFFDCGGGCCVAFMEWNDVPGVPSSYEAGINRGLGVPPGTFHFALRCESLDALETRRSELAGRGVQVSAVLDLPPYKSFFFDDPNGLRLEYTTRVGTLTAADRDPGQRCFPVSLSLFTDVRP